jgi:two-component system, OmpR family, sensor histidine kinase MprB
VSLRTRIAAAAGLAVALAVIVAAVAVYLGVRGELRREVDESLRDRAESVLDRGASLGQGGGGPGPPQDGGGPPGFDLPPEGRPEPFGGPEGYVQLVLPGGRVLRPASANEQLTVDSRSLEIARSGEGEDLTDLTAGGVHVRVLTTALPGGRGALQVARPVDEIDR